MLLAGALRLACIDAGWFGVDQARDVTWAELIASGQAYPIVGPLMRNRFHLGALYYWFWSLPAFFATGPLATYVYAGVLGTATVALVWLLTRALLGPAAALAAGALLATSPVAVLDARVAWAPAALPFWSVLLLLAATSFVRRPRAWRAAALLFVAGAGTQLHVAAAPLALVAGVLVLWQARALSWSGLLAAGAAGALPVLPMLLGLDQPLSAAATSVAAVADPTQHRVGDMVLLLPRLLTGLSPAGLPRLVDVWLAVEVVLGLATSAAALYALLRPARAGAAAPLRLVGAFFVAGMAAVALLPAEAWYYYLDAVLVPGVVLLAAAWQALRWRRAARWLLYACVAARSALLVWWIAGTVGQGYVATNLDFLRLGGARPAAEGARARVLSVATRERVADRLLRGAAIPLERAWRDVHGSGFSDLDTDNGYFLRRAASTPATEGAARDHGRSALVLYRGDFPAEWLARSSAPAEAGPLEIRTYDAAIDTGAAHLVGCGAATALPVPQPPAPLDYAAGEPALPRWPCASPGIEVPVRASPSDVVLRVFARTDGAARVVSISADPPGTPVVSAAPGAGSGIELAPGPARLLVRLDVAGPARLDLYELHGLR